MEVDIFTLARDRGAVAAVSGYVYFWLLPEADTLICLLLFLAALL